MSAKTSRFSVSIGRGYDGPRSTGDLYILGLSLSLYQIWLYLVVYNTPSLFGAPAQIDHYLSSYNASIISVFNLYPPLTIAYMASSAVCLLLAAYFHRRLKSVLLTRKVTIISGVLCIIGVLLIPLTQNEPSSIMLVVPGIITGIGSTVFLLRWGIIFSRFDFVTAVINSSFSFAFSLICAVILVNLLPAPVCGVLAICLPAAFIAIFFNRTEPTVDIQLKELPSHMMRGYYIRLALCLASYGVVSGLMSVICISEMTPIAEITFDLLLGAGGMVSVLIILVALVLSKKETRWDWLFRAIVPIVAIGCACIPLLIGDGVYFGAFFLSFAFICLEVLLWVLISSLASDIDAVLIFGLGCGVIRVFSIAGILAISNINYWTGFPLEFFDVINFDDAHMKDSFYIISIVMCVLVILGYSLLPRYYELKRILSAVLNGMLYSNLNESDALTDLAKTKDGASIPLDSASLPLISADDLDNEGRSSVIETAPLDDSDTLNKDADTEIGPNSGPDLADQNSYASNHDPANSRDMQCGVDSDLNESDLNEGVQREYNERHEDEQIGMPQEANPLASSGNASVDSPDSADLADSKPLKREERGSFMRRCDEISRVYNLSKREQEVLVLLAKGHNASFITDKLCISRSTAKTHINHIYRKLDIHTQQELLNMVEDRKHGAIGASVDRDTLRMVIQKAMAEHQLENNPDNPENLIKQIESDLMSSK